MGTPASALGSTLGGAGSLLQGVASLLPQATSTKGHTEADSTATSNTTGTQTEEGSSSATTKSSGKSTSTGTQSESSNLSDVTKTIANTKVNQTATGVESFSGQENTTTSQLQLNEEGIMRIINLMLAGQGGVEGLDSIVRGERTAGLFDSSTNQLLTSNLATTIAGEVAKLTAPTVTTQNLGATTTTNKQTAETISQAITDAISNSFGTRDLQTSDVTTSDMTELMSQLLSNVTNASQTSQQSSNLVQDSKSKSKSGIGFCAITTLTAGLLHSADLLTDIRAFRDTYLLPVNPELVATYYRETPKYVMAINNLSMDDADKATNYLNATYLIPLVKAYKAGDYTVAEGLFKAYIEESRTLIG